MTNPNTQKTKYASVKDFYPLYLSEHQHTMNRVLHFFGAGLMALSFITAMLFHAFVFFLSMVITGFILAWLGHLLFEKNKPSTLKHPFLSFACDFLLFGDIIMGRESFKAK
ncbi:Mpo1-like protein [Pedobacter sp. AW31-3R]|uniref:Mpo1-like protein n=1 Tax=Pedobacter sp. AW31-3R TaxID=3445781 RepID=UPI003F9EC848